MFTGSASASSELLLCFVAYRPEHIWTCWSKEDDQGFIMEARKREEMYTVLETIFQLFEILLCNSMFSQYF